MEVFWDTLLRNRDFSLLPQRVLLILIRAPFSYNRIGGGVDSGHELQGVAVVPLAGDEVLKGGADPLLLHDVPHLQWSPR